MAVMWSLMRDLNTNHSATGKVKHKLMHASGRVSMHPLSQALAIFITLLTVPAAAQQNPTWTTQLPPFQIADNLYYVGSEDLASYLVTTPAGDILINANLNTSPPQIRASVEKLSFRWADTKILLNGQAHSDHVGGAAEVVRETHAQVMTMDGDASVMESGGRTDFAFGKRLQFAPVHVDRVLHDGEAITLGGITLIAHKTAGHTRGCTTFSLRVHQPGTPASQLRDVVIIGGLNTQNYRLIETPDHPAAYPGIAADFRHTIALLRSLPCDIFLGAHGQYFDLLPKLKRMPAEGNRVWIDPAGYKAAIDDAEQTFNEKLAKQRAAK